MIKNNKIILSIGLIHIIPIITLIISTLPHLKFSSSFIYLLFMISFTANILFSIYLQIKHQSGTFFYFLSVLFFLGFAFKFSFHVILGHPYIEPIGSFVFNQSNIQEVLLIGTTGALGLFLSQIISYYFFIKKKASDILHESSVPFLLNYKTLSILTILTILMSYLNLKYNILLFGFTPSVNLPLKGNVIFFLLLTRFFLFAMLYYCFKKFSYISILWGAIIVMIASVGVLSRMVIISFFAVPGLYLLQNIEHHSITNTLKKLFYLILVFGFISWLTVLFSSRLREIYIPTTASKTIKQSPSLIKKLQIASNSNSAATITSYKGLALERWIGMEGVMAVVSYPNKSFSFLWDALCEKSYKGKSFYNKISSPVLFSQLEMKQSLKNISTSVPGPIAFFYYTGSLVFVFFITFLSCFLIFLIEHLLGKYSSIATMSSIFISVFMTFDFFQFGISPITFVKYWGFTFFCLSIFLLFESKRFKSIFQKI